MKSPQFKLVIIFIVLYSVQLIISSRLIYNTYIDQVKVSLKGEIKRVKEDISFKNGEWDTSLYNADPEIPGRFRLYVFSSDGFVVERWRPIPGFLDVSDLKKLLDYQTPQTIHTITNQDWRIYSKTIKDKGNRVIGAITVSSFNTNKLDVDEINEIDNRLKESADILFSKIELSNKGINIDKIDIRSVPFYISFQVVDQFNSILIKNNNSSSMDKIPNFIDPSYVQREIVSPTSGQITDPSSKDTYQVMSSPLTDNNGQAYGLVVAARITTELQGLIKNYIYSNSVLGIILTIFFALILRSFKKGSTQTSNNQLLLDDVKVITFLKEECSIVINDLRIPFTYATNQYYMCQALFSAPRKKWETDELIEKFGEETSKDSWRIIYDSMAAINTKISEILPLKLIIVSNKTYRINPKLISKIPKK